MQHIYYPLNEVKMHISTCEGWAINRFYRLTRMCSLRRLVWMKISFLFNIRRRSSEWGQPSPRAYWADRRQVYSTWSSAAQNDVCVTSKYYESDKRADGSLCFRIALTQGSFCAALLQVEYTWCHRPSPMADRHHNVEPIQVSRHRDPPPIPPAIHRITIQ